MIQAIKKNGRMLILLVSMNAKEQVWYVSSALVFWNIKN
jgi:hypothetical protein